MITVRPSTIEDSTAILDIASREALFNPEERRVIAELLTDYLNRQDHNGYYFLSALNGSEVIAFACYGPTPLTEGTFDLYWISVHSDWKNKGIGRQLMEGIIQRVRLLKGRLLLADTSGKEAYTPTRAFYERQGFTPAGRIKDFYAPGDDLVVYALHLHPLQDGLLPTGLGTTATPISTLVDPIS